MNVGAAAVLAAVMLVARFETAAACTLMAPWAIRDTSWVGFMGVALGDTVLAGPGLSRPAVAPGHYGPGAPREIFGQRVRMERLGTRGESRMPSGALEAVLVPWDFGADCARVAWNRSARWLVPGTRGLFRARLRPDSLWVDGLPTFDVNDPAQQPYPQSLDRAWFRSASSPSPMAPEDLLRLLDDLPSNPTEPDSVVEFALLRRLTADAALAGQYPATELIHQSRYAWQEARTRGLRIPVAGTFRLEASLDDGPWRSFYVRTSPRASSFDLATDEPPPGTVGPSVPPGYSIQASIAASESGLAPDCAWLRGRLIAYVELDWHDPIPGDGTGSWKGGLDERMFEVLLDSAGIAEWRARGRRATQARFDAARARDGQRAAVRYVPNRPLRFVQEPGLPMRIEGAITFDGQGTFRIRGTRISSDTIACRS